MNTSILALSLAALVAAGCVPGSGGPCNVVCGGGTHCDPVSGFCVADPADLGAAGPVDMTPPPACDPPCSGALGHCSANHRCVACIADDHCPAGNLCKNDYCVPGCADDTRCAGNGNGKTSCCGGQCVDPKTDNANCGGCGQPCMVAHASASCAGGACKSNRCDPGWGDCNNDPKDGCEAPLHADPNNCGKCATVCKSANGIAGCSDTCYLKACNFGYDDCDGMPENGCETSVLSDAKNCGGCGMPCGTPAHAKASCVTAACVLTSCDQGFADCNNIEKDGCETVTATDANNCGKCGAVCPQGLVCVNGGCTCQQCNIPNAMTMCVNNQCVFASCLKGYGDCDNNVGNGCEVNLGTSPANCGACGMACPMNTPFCFNGACQAMLPGVLLGAINGQSYYKVQVMELMTDTNVFAACKNSGFKTPCQAQQGCQFNDNACAPTQENSCGNPMQGLAKAICNGANPPQCPALSNCFQYMGHTWVNDSACGTLNGNWCVVGNMAMNGFAICTP